MGLSSPYSPSHLPLLEIIVSEMLPWAHITGGILSVIVLSFLLVFFLRRWCCIRQQESSSPLNAASPIRSDNFQARISKLHQTSLIRQQDTSDIKRRGNIINNSVSRTGRGIQSKLSLFTWTDYPALVTEAVENGWMRFGFSVHAPVSLLTGASPRSTLLGLCRTTGVGYEENDPGVVIKWEVSNDSVDFMQTIKFNQEFKEIVNAKNQLIVLRAALPLPGPQLITSTFPQEVYFEITILKILYCNREGYVSSGLASVDGEKTKLFMREGPKLVKRREWDGEGHKSIISLGLATGFPVGSGLPGKFPASIGFQSDGAVYLDGMKLVCESEKHEWAKENKIVGCGYDPRKKKVYFTVNSHLVHVINCKADEFGTPLYPTLASNTEATIVVNLGQSPFNYEPANAQRIPNPSIGVVSGLEDSKELFSIGRLDSQYLSNVFTNRGNTDEIVSGRTTVGNSYRRKVDYDEESDADLFEIALERSSKPTPDRL